MNPRELIGISSLFLLAVLCKSACGISCYQCLSTDHENPFQCNEFMNDADITPQSCENIFDAQYCVKHTGRFEGGLGTKRFCSPLDLGTYCNYIQQPGDELEYRSCVYTCSTDGCNSASAIKLEMSFIFFMIGALLMRIVFPYVGH